VSVLRIVIWNLADSKTTLDEVRDRLPSLPDGDVWIANDAQERFGIVSTSGAMPDFATLRALIGKDPEIAEEYDALE
jgi:hypothetical protein